MEVAALSVTGHNRRSEYGIHIFTSGLFQTDRFHIIQNAGACALLLGGRESGKPFFPVLPRIKMSNVDSVLVVVVVRRDKEFAKRLICQPQHTKEGRMTYMECTVSSLNINGQDQLIVDLDGRLDSSFNRKHLCLVDDNVESRVGECWVNVILLVERRIVTKSKIFYLDVMLVIILVLDLGVELREDKLVRDEMVSESLCQSPLPERTEEEELESGRQSVERRVGWSEKSSEGFTGEDGFTRL